MPCRSAISVHDDLAARQPRIAFGTARHKPPGRVDVNAKAVLRIRWNHRVDNVLFDGIA